MQPKDFYIATRASRGVRVELVDPAGNREWVQVRSVLSKQFQQASREVIRQAAIEGKAVMGCPQELKRQIRQRRAELVSALIVDWSMPLHGQDMIDLLIQNPRLRRGIEQIAADHDLHFGVSA